LPLAQKETGTITWYAFQEDQGNYGIFDTFETEDARQAHLDGPIAKALMAKAGELLAVPPAIHKIRLVATKIPGGK
jgi:quinol monooxygenase YgiN